MTSPPTVRKLVVEVIDARDLVPKDGQGTSSPYVVIEFAGQRKRTHTRARDLNPQWNERHEFIVSDPSSMELEELNVEVYNDKRLGPAASAAPRKNNFLGRVRIYGSQFARRGEEGLIYFPLEKRGLLSWIHGEIGLKIYYFDEEKNPDDAKKPESVSPLPPSSAPEPPEIPAPTEAAVEPQSPLAIPVAIPVINAEEIPPTADQAPPPSAREDIPLMPDVKKAQNSVSFDRVRMTSRRNGTSEYAHSPRVITGQFMSSSTDPLVPSVYDLVEPMQYLFIRIVRARGLRKCESPYVKIRSGSHSMRSKSARDASCNPEWNQVFALNQSKPDPTLEISVWDGSSGEAFLGGVCFDLSDVPVRDPPDGPLAPQWYHLEGGEDRHVTGDIMLSVWLGTQADDAFPESCNSDAPYITYTRSKVYQSPKLWYLRASVIEAQDLRVPSPSLGSPVNLYVKIQLGFQSARTRRSISNCNASTFSWLEDLMFVVSEPLGDQLIVLVEDRSAKDPILLAHAAVPVASLDQRFDERQLVPPKWFSLDNIGSNGQEHGLGVAYGGRIQLRLCLEGGYHVLDEAAHVCSDFRPTAKQLWRPVVGSLELGILGARGLQPMKTKSNGKGSTDAYCIAKYGKKWTRTRTITDSFDPRWNEQYTWKVYDPCTVLTIAVFDNWRMFAEGGEDRPDYRIGKIRIRVSTLESNRIYTQSYPLLVLLRSGLKKMGEIRIAVRFASSALLPDTCALYATPMLPRMHYLRPLGVAQQEALRGAAIRIVAAWLARAEPPLGPEVVRYMLDADSHSWSLRRSKANWFRILGVIAWVVGLAQWLDDLRRWRNPMTTVLVHILYLVLVWYPELAAPTATLYLFLIGAWYYRFRPRGPTGMDARLSQAEGAEVDELDEEFDGVPTGKAAEVVKLRYDRLRTLAARVQSVMGDLAAQGERVQALVSWRDPRATRVFIVMCLVMSLVLYMVPLKMVMVALGFYFLRHPMFRDPMPPAALNFFRRLPSLSDRLL
ncbi:protein QUIRKY [Phalaenopsis equestris]|uniref:protein QUIRKY n=1 Tax=Phalaenopsis equestris TaxID=78828 RepID=UPI0009E585B6|nr:protein QUIRKY [Phalaenopsis equestris]